ncbi:hypothetical protein P43SY_001495 [Pythium insidiosum]|uniref:Elicitin-like protein n=1 Tax=Pythium insidiosum TaxID=114742 RepID=A0AAD5LCH0_PYTIN|nr:hypothetical protein P43SY_001495 [Pythium insidiosum]
MALMRCSSLFFLCSMAVAMAANTAPRVRDGECSIQEMNHLNEVLQVISSGYPPECASLRGLTPDLVSRTLCNDRNCKTWVIDTLKLRDCGNPALGDWQDIATKRLAQCSQFSGSPGTPGTSKAPVTGGSRAGQSGSVDAADNTKLPAATPASTKLRNHTAQHLCSLVVALVVALLHSAS